MAVKLISAPPEDPYNYDEMWEGLSAAPHWCSSCRATVQIEYPSDIKIVLGNFLRADCPHCFKQESVVITVNYNWLIPLSRTQKERFVNELIDNGAINHESVDERVDKILRRIRVGYWTVALGILLALLALIWLSSPSS